MDVFLSSVISGFETYRAAAAQAVETLGHKLIRAEDFGASPASPQETCLRGVRAAQVVILVLGERYGALQPSGFSATHEEYLEAKERCQVLAFIQDGITREARQESFVSDVQAWVTGHYTSRFDSPDRLRDAVTLRLHELELSQASTPTDTSSLLANAQEMVSELEGNTEALVVALAPGPTQQVLRPSALESPDLTKALISMSVLGDYAVMTHQLATQDQVRGHALILSQEGSSVLLDESGAVRVICSPTTPIPGTFGGSRLIEEDVQTKIERSLRLGAEILDHVDPVHRLNHVVPVVGLLDSGYRGWATRAEQAQQGNTWYPTNHNRIVVNLRPESRTRSALTLEASGLAADFTVLLRREARADRR